MAKKEVILLLDVRPTLRCIVVHSARKSCRITFASLCGTVWKLSGFSNLEPPLSLNRPFLETPKYLLNGLEICTLTKIARTFEFPLPADGVTLEASVRSSSATP